VGYSQPMELGSVRAVLTDMGYPGAVVQHFGTTRDVLIRIAPREDVSQAEVSDQILAGLRKATTDRVDLRRVEFVGPQVGRELAEEGGLALLIALGGILIYLALRFEFRLAVGAIAATLHDTLFTVGFFSLLGLPFDLTVLAAVLAVIGYSVNDTVVVFDRIRENFRKLRRESPVEVMNAAINQTLSRTIMTSGTTLVVVLALYLFGGELLAGFSLTLIIGIVVGTFSSIYIASPIALALGIDRADLMPVKKEGAELDGRP
jgi:preprotein translocase subunit SecF